MNEGSQEYVAKFTDNNEELQRILILDELDNGDCKYYLKGEFPITITHNYDVPDNDGDTNFNIRVVVNNEQELERICDEWGLGYEFVNVYDDAEIFALDDSEYRDITVDEFFEMKAQVEAEAEAKKEALLKKDIPVTYLVDGKAESVILSQAQLDRIDKILIEK